jgi:hypothetical protein
MTPTNSELITGTGCFQAKIEAMLGRRVQPGQRGRPRNQIETTSLSKEKNNEQLSFEGRF